MCPAVPRDTTAFDVRDGLREPGCVVCRLALRSVLRLLRSVAYEQINDPTLRSELRKRGGFCTTHAHQWLREAHSVLGTALIYKDVLQAALRDLEAPSLNGQRGRLLRGLLGPGSSDIDAACPACRAQNEAEARYLEALLTLLASDDACVSTFDASDGVCRRHTLSALRSGRAGAEHVTRRTRETVADLIGVLDEVIRKEDYRFRHEPRSDAERAAPARAIDWAAGSEGLTTS
jgi:hypothetical protein